MNILRKSLLLFLSVTWCYALSAQQFYYEGILFEVLSDQPTAVRVFQVNRCMKSFEIPEKVNDQNDVEYDVTRIGNIGFRNACSLVDLHLGKVEMIEKGYLRYYEDGAVNCQGGFYNCTDLSKVNMPCINSIGDYAFYKCPALSQLIIGEQLKQIGKGAFMESPSLSLLQINAAQPPVCAPDAFMDLVYETAVLRVPQGKKSVYQQADVWKRFKHIEEMGGPTGIGDVEGVGQRLHLKVLADKLRIEGLCHGESVSLYTIDGRLLQQGTATDGVMQMKVEAGKTYLVKVGTRTLKVRN